MAVTVVRGSSSATSQGVGSSAGSAATTSSSQSNSAGTDLVSEAVEATVTATVVVEEISTEAAVYFSRSVSGDVPKEDIRAFDDANEAASFIAGKIRDDSEPQGRQAHGDIESAHTRGHLTA